MKRNRIAALLLALVMMVSMLPTAMAANDTYKLTVTITDSGAGSTGGSVTDSVNYLTGDTNLLATIGTLVAGNYENLRIFESPAMRNRLDHGLRVYTDSGEWSEFVELFENDGAYGDLLPLIADFDTTVDALTPNRTYTITYLNVVDGDAKVGVTYTVSATLTKRTTSKPKPTVEIKDSEDGKAELVSGTTSSSTPPSTSSSASSHRVQVGEKVTIELTPDEGYRPNRVLVTDKNGDPVSVKAQDNNTYTFVVPAGGVTVTTTFIQMPTPVEETGVDRMLNTDPNSAYIQGKADGKFHPSDSITRGQVAAIFYRLLKEEYANTPHTKNFDDVPDDFWCSNAVNTLAALGIVNGMTADEFAPNKAITRAQFVAICARFADSMTEGETFIDVPEEYWAYDYISTGSGHGWINGVGGGRFDPNAPITRAQAVAIVNRMLCRIADRAAIDALEEQFYHDVSDTHWAWYDVGEASQGDLTRGD